VGSFSEQVWADSDERHHGLTAAFAATYGRLRNGFYGLRSTVLMLLFLALLRDPRAEGATRIRPADLGRLLGLDRAPEVKTLRRKLTELAGCRRGAALQAALARAHAAARPDALGFLGPTTKPAPCSGRRSPCPATCTSPGTPCTSGSTLPPPRAAAVPYAPSASSSPRPEPATPTPT